MERELKGAGRTLDRCAVCGGPDARFGIVCKDGVLGLCERCQASHLALIGRGCITVAQATHLLAPPAAAAVPERAGP